MARAEEDLHVLTRAGNRSPFIDEIDEYCVEDVTVAHVATSEAGDRIDMTAKVQRLWDDIHPKQHQAGVIEDRSGTRKFVSWRSDDPPTVVPDLWYHFENLRIDEYQNETRVVLDGKTTTIQIDRSKALEL